MNNVLYNNIIFNIINKIFIITLSFMFCLQTIIKLKIRNFKSVFCLKLSLYYFYYFYFLF